MGIALFFLPSKAIFVTDEPPTVPTERWNIPTRHALSLEYCTVNSGIEVAHTGGADLECILRTGKVFANTNAEQG